MDSVLGNAITVVVVDPSNRTVDGELLKVGTLVTVELGVEVRENAALQQRVLAEVDAADKVADLELEAVRSVSRQSRRVVRPGLTMICSVSAK